MMPRMSGLMTIDIPLIGQCSPKAQRLTVLCSTLIQDQDPNRSGPEVRKEGVRVFERREMVRMGVAMQTFRKCGLDGLTGP